MDAREATRAFKEADTLFRADRFDGALRVLQELDRAYPRRKNILFPMALCMAKLGHTDDAERLCEQLEVEFQDPRVRTLKAHLATVHVEPTTHFDANAFDVHILDDLLSPHVPPKAQKKRRVITNRVRYALIAAAVLAFLVVAPLVLWLL